MNLSCIKPRIDEAERLVLEIQAAHIYLHLFIRGSEELYTYEEFPFELFLYIFRNRPDVIVEWVKPLSAPSLAGTIAQGAVEDMEREMKDALGRIKNNLYHKIRRDIITAYETPPDNSCN